MPRPLSQVKHSGTLYIGNNTDHPSDHRPELALLAMKVISAWSIMESFLSGLFVQMLGSNPAPAAAIFNALTSTAAQTAALRALAQATLSKRDQELFEAVLILLKRAAGPRNKVAHWVWGHSSSLPDAILLCDPRALIQHRIELDGYIAMRTGPRIAGTKRPPIPEIPQNEIQVWKADDFVDAIGQIDKLTGYIMQFRFMILPIHPANEGDLQYNLLCNEPEIQTALSRLRKGQSSPKEPRSPPLQGGKPRR